IAVAPGEHWSVQAGYPTESSMSSSGDTADIKRSLREIIDNNLNWLARRLGLPGSGAPALQDGLFGRTFRGHRRRGAARSPERAMMRICNPFENALSYAHTL